MSFINKLFGEYSAKARQKRAMLFRDSFKLDENTRVLDLGSENGSNINSVLSETNVRPENVYIADIDPGLLQQGADNFGFVQVLIDESEQLPFEDKYFDVVYCSSVIEHVTVPKDEIWTMYSGKEFREKSFLRQKQFADEVKRLGKQYFVQTPYRHFPMESHSWLPFAGWLPRFILIPLLKITNRIWVKRTSPDWNLLNRKEMSDLFEDASIIAEKSAGLTKSIMAVKR